MFWIFETKIKISLNSPLETDQLSKNRFVYWNCILQFILIKYYFREIEQKNSPWFIIIWCYIFFNDLLWWFYFQMEICWAWNKLIWTFSMSYDTCSNYKIKIIERLYLIFRKFKRRYSRDVQIKKVKINCSYKNIKTMINELQIFSTFRLNIWHLCS